MKLLGHEDSSGVCSFVQSHPYFFTIVRAFSFQVILAVKMRYFKRVKLKKYFNHSHFRTKTSPRSRLKAHKVFTKILTISTNTSFYTLQYSKYVSLAQNPTKTCVYTQFSTIIGRLHLCTIKTQSLWRHVNA